MSDNSLILHKLHNYGPCMRKHAYEHKIHLFTLLHDQLPVSHLLCTKLYKLIVLDCQLLLSVYTLYY